MCERIIVLVDMDCFYCQVETRLNPSLKGKPVAVVQYNQWQGGGIIAVNYEARCFGVTRHIRGNEAKKKCPNINLVHVPSVRGKADLTRYRDAGREVVDVLCRFCDVVERASIDEAYLDLTQAVESRWRELGEKKVKLEHLPTTFVVGFSENDSNDEEARHGGLSSWLDNIYHSEMPDNMSEKLAVAALLVEEMRTAVYESTGFRCSAGIAPNKILAKLACGLHKPQRQTILPATSVPVLYQTLPIKKVRGLGGKFGDIVSKKLDVSFIGELEQFSESQLQEIFNSKSGHWLYNIARGHDYEPVTARLKSKSIGCCKKFPGKLALATVETVEHWMSELTTEVAERLDKELEGRRATQIIVSYMQTIDGQDVSSSRCGTLSSHSAQQLLVHGMELLKGSNSASSGSCLWVPPLKFLGLSVGKFVEREAKIATLEGFFKVEAKIPDANGIKEKDLTSFLDSCLANKEEIKNDMNASDKPSFFVHFMKEEGLIRTPKSKKRKQLVPESRRKKCFYRNTSESTDINQSASSSGLKSGACLKEPLSTNESSDTELLVSPCEIFPDLDNVDDAVAALLPSPLQHKLRSRIEKHVRSRKSLVYSTTVSATEEKTFQGKFGNDISSKNVAEDAGKGSPESKAALVDAQQVEDISHRTKETISCDVAISDELQVKSNVNHICDKIIPCPESDYSQNENWTVGKGVIRELCPHCQESIEFQDYPEHLDYHVAAELDHKLNKSSLQQVSSVGKAVIPSVKKSPFKHESKSKRGRQGAKQTHLVADKTRSITTFFARIQ